MSSQKSLIKKTYSGLLRGIETVLSFIFPHAFVKVCPPNDYAEAKDITKLDYPFYRIMLAEMFINKGSGIEVGALHNPQLVPKNVEVKYVDRMSLEDLYKHYPEFKNRKVVNPDYIDDGETLSTVPDASQDFVIANSILEHFPNPMKALANMMRVLKPGGILFAAIPDKRYIFDKDRAVTPYQHILEEYRTDKAEREEHFLDWARHLFKLTDETEIREKAQELMDEDYSIHFHCWTQNEILEMIIGLSRDLDIAFHIKMLVSIRDPELIAILEKR